jgi:hypothetical protein
MLEWLGNLAVQAQPAVRTATEAVAPIRFLPPDSPDSNTPERGRFTPMECDFVR